MTNLPAVSAPEDPMLNLRKLASKTGDLPPLPVTAFTALRMTEDPRVSARDLQLVISRDQALSAKILRIVNSPLYGLRAEISTVSHAVAILGLDALRSIIMAAAVQQTFQTFAVGGQNLTTKLLSEHSWGAAVAARKIAECVRYANLEEAFLCGLMHDIGKLVFLKNFHSRYTEVVINDVYRGQGTFHDSELALFGFSHAHIGALLGEKWNFPPQLWEAIGYHHNPMSAPEHVKLACIVNLADAMMIVLERGFQKDPQFDLAAAPSPGFLRLEARRLEEIVAELKSAPLDEPAVRHR